ncbi:MAG TPA: iron-containing redox enzyme family protein [Candidatus Binatia bacterium]|jgi:pyrroloquinoline quinone (PQQ) biosynthesis protein C
MEPAVKEKLNQLRREIIQPAPLLHHPVVQARIKGEFTLDQLCAVEIQHYYEAKYFSTIVLNTVKNCNDNLVWRKWMAENWVSEATGEKDHATLILNLLDALKVPRKKIDATDPTPGMRAWHEILEGITTRRSFAEGVAALWIGEPEYPQVAAALYKAYRDVYKIDEAALETYQFHADHDAEHGLQEEDIVVAALEADPNAYPRLRSVCRDAYSAYLFSFDGYWQAATGKREFWSGVKPYI